MQDRPTDLHPTKPYTLRAFPSHRGWELIPYAPNADPPNPRLGVIMPFYPDSDSPQDGFTATYYYRDQDGHERAASLGRYATIRAAVDDLLWANNNDAGWFAYGAAEARRIIEEAERAEWE